MSPRPIDSPLVTPGHRRSKPRSSLRATRSGWGFSAWRRHAQGLLMRPPQVFKSWLAVALLLFQVSAHTASIDSLEKVTLGGIAQWILLQGNDTSQPVLLVLHGGPGYAMLPLLHEYNRELEDHFIVVNWDQRGAGRSYNRGIRSASMTLARFLSDAHELTDLLKQRFAQNKIYVLGHSWGTVMGLWLINQYPDDYYAFVGVGQVVDTIENEQVMYDWALSQAIAYGNEEGQRQLLYVGRPDDAGEYPRGGASGYDIAISWAGYFGGDLWGKHGTGEIEDWLLGTEEYAGKWGLKLRKGWTFSQVLFDDPAVWNLDFREAVPEVKVPVYFFAGRHDYDTPFELVEDYYRTLIAPSKDLLWFENSAHFPFYEEPELFNSSMIYRVKAETYPQ